MFKNCQLLCISYNALGPTFISTPIMLPISQRLGSEATHCWSEDNTTSVLKFVSSCLQYAEYEQVVVEDRIEKEKIRRLQEQELEELKATVRVRILVLSKTKQAKNDVLILKQSSDKYFKIIRKESLYPLKSPLNMKSKHFG